MKRKKAKKPMRSKEFEIWITGDISECIRTCWGHMDAELILDSMRCAWDEAVKQTEAKYGRRISQNDTTRSNRVLEAKGKGTIRRI